MPELPEVETIRQYLDDQLVGLTVATVVHLDPRMIKLGECDAPTIAGWLIGQRLAAVKRRGKYLLFGWRDGGWLIIHLGMSGRLTVNSETDPTRPHTHMVLDFGSSQLRLCDPRRFGRVGWVDQWTDLDHRLGVEPLSGRFTARYLYRQLQGKSAPIKALLLSQSVVAGLGNIYVDEALYASRVHPAQPGKSLDSAMALTVVRNVRRVLRQSLLHRGTSFSDYVDALGERGQNQDYLAVYGRRGDPCRRCRTPIETIVIQGRTSHFCPKCQHL